VLRGCVPWPDDLPGAISRRASGRGSQSPRWRSVLRVSIRARLPLVYGEVRITYGEMITAAKRLATALVHQGFALMTASWFSCRTCRNSCCSTWH
jgi:non-ribosomal peptide synthetase component E (peptide arylation enzyme)